MPRLDALDETFVALGGPHPDAIAGGDDVALVGGEALEQPPHGAAQLPAIVGLHHAGQAVDTQHAARHMEAGIGGGHRGCIAARGGAGVVLHDGALARQVALGADALAAGGGLLGEAVILKSARPILGARRLRAILAQLDADFLFLGHQVCLRFRVRSETTCTGFFAASAKRQACERYFTPSLYPRTNGSGSITSGKPSPSESRRNSRSRPWLGRMLTRAKQSILSPFSVRMGPSIFAGTLKSHSGLKRSTPVSMPCTMKCSSI